jgi:hypothetical protein
MAKTSSSLRWRRRWSPWFAAAAMTTLRAALDLGRGCRERRSYRDRSQPLIPPRRLSGLPIATNGRRRWPGDAASATRSCPSRRSARTAACGLRAVAGGEGLCDGVEVLLPAGQYQAVAAGTGCCDDVVTDRLGASAVFDQAPEDVLDVLAGAAAPHETWMSMRRGRAVPRRWGSGGWRSRSATRDAWPGGAGTAVRQVDNAPPITPLEAESVAADLTRFVERGHTPA